MKKKSKKKITIIIVICFIILSIGIGAGIIYLKTSDKMVNYLITDMLEAEVAKGLGETLGDEVIISDPKVIENLGLTLPSLDKEAGSTSSVDASKLEQGKSDESKEETVEEIQPVKVSKKELEEAIENKVESVTSQVTVSDKTAMTNLILKYVDKSDINYLAGLMLDGVSAEDIAIAKQIARESFPEEAMDEVYSYYKKYAGLIANK